MTLPPSSDKEFWGENEIYVFDKPEALNTGDHYFVWRGPHAVCVKCPYEHTVPIDFRKYDIKHGQFVKRK
jgi:hypothetical protein